MNTLLNGEEHRLPLDEIEKLLFERNAPAGTQLFQAHYWPSWLTNSTITFVISGETAEVTLCIWSWPRIVDTSIVKNLLFSDEYLVQFSDYPRSLAKQPKWIEEQCSVPQTLVQHIQWRM